MIQKSDASRRLAAASARLLELAEKGESSFAAELLRRIAAVGQDAVAVEVGDAELDRKCREAANGMLDRADAEEEVVRRATGLADASGTPS